MQISVLALMVAALASLLFGPHTYRRGTSTASSAKPSLSMPLNTDSEAEL